MKVVGYTLRLLLLLVLLLLSLEVAWRLMTLGQRNHILHQIPAVWLEYFPVSPTQGSLFQFVGPRIVIPERPLSDDFPPPAEPDAVDLSRQISVYWPGGNGPVVHGNGDVCLKPDSIEVPEVKPPKTGVYKWVDEHGKVHFGDKPTSTSEDLSKQYRVSDSGMTVKLEYPDWDGSKTVAADLQKEAELMHRIFTKFVPKQHRRRVDLNITLFKNRQSFARYRTEQGIPRSTGAFYRGEEHRIYMPMLDSDSATRSVARHEMTHAMTVAMLGSLPIWLMEGIAEYMGRLKWHMSVATVPMDTWSMRQLDSTKPMSLEQLTSMTHQQFYSLDKQKNYAKASLLVHFLMEHNDGKTWLKHTLAGFANEPCQAFDPAVAFGHHYPGGLAGLSQRFEKWMDAREHFPHRY